MLHTLSTVFFQTKNTTISILEQPRCMLCITNGFQTSAAYREQAMRQIEATVKFKLHAIIWDLRTAEVIGKADQDWTINEWQPKVIEAGHRLGAIILPEGIFGQLSVKTIISSGATSRGEEVTTQYFPDLESTLAWVEGALAAI